jgi:hypothetical protein
VSIQGDILHGIDVELKTSSKPEKFEVEAKQKDGSVWKVWLTPGQYGGRLDESLEGAYAWWPGDQHGVGKGTADVLSVVPEEELVVLRFVTSPLPESGKELLIYPIQYLQKLRDLWADEAFAEARLQWWDQSNVENEKSGSPVDPSRYRWLRSRQRDAFQLPAWKVAFLWGPPGTGKTTTLGALLGRFLQQFPSHRVLLLSTTNSAVDQAIVAVDNALAELTATERQPSLLRRSCLRIGTHFVPRYYEDEQHLLPTKDFSHLERLMELYRHEPPRQQAQQYSRWKSEIESIQNEIRKQAVDALKRARLAALTTTGAAFRYHELTQLSQYDLVVFDEASQVSVVHALTLAGLGRHVLFAGDPKQLAPVVQSEDTDAREWLGKSPFESMQDGHGSTCLLDEQSRMAQPICDLISHTFYRGKLKVASDKKNDQKWRSEREAFYLPGQGKRNAYLILTDAEAKYVPKMGGNVRFETAEQIVQLVHGLTENRLKEEDILVITPYRAQRALIRRKLRNAGYKKIQVSTVHRAQGSERDTVIFDPVSADNRFMNNEDLGPRLINVAVSRAKARVVLFASPENRRNPYIAQIAGIIENSAPTRRAESIHQYLFWKNFPDCVIGKTVDIPHPNRPSLIVKVTGLDPSGSKLVGVNCLTGAPIMLSIEHLQNAAVNVRHVVSAEGCGPHAVGHKFSIAKEKRR